MNGKKMFNELKNRNMTEIKIVKCEHGKDWCNYSKNSSQPNPIIVKYPVCFRD